MSVTIKVDTGFVGAIHEMEAINENIDAYAVDSEDDETDLGV